MKNYISKQMYSYIFKFFFIFSILIFNLNAENNTPIKIGVITSLNPLVETWSKNANIGFLKAADEINKKGGIKGRKIKFIFEDDRFLPKNALAAYHKLRNVDKVDFIIGPQFDQTMSAVRHLANKDKQLLIQTIGTNPVNKEEYGYIIHACPSDKFVGKALAKKIIEDRHKKISFIIPEESYNQNLANYVKENLLNIEFNSINYQIDISDYKPILLKAKKYKPDALVFLFITPDIASHIYKLMKQLKINIPIYTSETLHNNKKFIKEVGGLASETIYFLVDFDKNSNKISSFLNSLKEKPTLPFYTVIAYDTLNWLSTLIDTYGTDNQKIKDAIYQMNYKGLYKNYKFDKYGDHENVELVPWKITESSFVKITN